jgi:sulfite exporter TauE/SafE
MNHYKLLQLHSYLTVGPWVHPRGIWLHRYVAVPDFLLASAGVLLLSSGFAGYVAATVRSNVLRLRMTRDKLC